MTSNFGTVSFEPFTPTELLGQWRVDESTTVSREAARLGVAGSQMREDLEYGGYLGVMITFDEGSFALIYDGETAPRHVGSYTHAAGIPCGINQLWLQFTWDEMIAQPYQYLLLTQQDGDTLEIEWPNDRFVHYRRHS